ncbi:MAG: hypothetical protein ACLRXD_05150 [Coprococcus sp.]
MLLEQAIGEYGDKLDKAGLKVVFTGSDTPAVVMADGQHLWRVFDNLLANISKYAMPGTRVYASVIRGDGEVRMEFKNISRDPLNVSSDELMERFVRGDSSRNTEGKRTGIIYSEQSVYSDECQIYYKHRRRSVQSGHNIYR